ncbi:MAG: hypothetical protein ACOYN0_14850, partial [Phycisphaerales bacterium]
LRSWSVARTAYDSLRFALAQGRVPPLFDERAPATRYQGTRLQRGLMEEWQLEFGGIRQLWDWESLDWDYSVATDFFPPGATNPDGSAVEYLPQAPIVRRHSYYDNFLRRFFDTRDFGDTFGAYGRFGLESLLELNAFRTRNDLATLSPLESTMAARDNSFPSNGTVSGSVRFDPLRSNRPETERLFAVDRVENANPNTARPDGKADLEDLHLSRTDVRQLLTTISGSRLLRPASGVDPKNLLAGSFSDNGDPELRQSPDTYLAPLHKRLDSHTLLVTWVGPTGSPPAPSVSALLQQRRFNARKAAQVATESLFQVYSRLLDGTPRYRLEDPADQQNADNALRTAMWFDPGTGQPANEFNTAFYGGKGPEAMLRAAGHMAVNAADMRDRDRRFVLAPVAGQVTGESLFELANPDPDRYLISARPSVVLETETIESTVAQFTTYSNPIGGVEGGVIIANNGLGRADQNGSSVRFEKEANILYPAANSPANPTNDFAVRFDAPVRIAKTIVSPPSADYVPPSGGAVEQLKLFGVEPQPFITQVAVFTTYVDQPTPSEGPGQNANINGRVNPTDFSPVWDPAGGTPYPNPDFVCRVLAFRVVNPFDTKLDYHYLNRCYIRFGNQVFRLRQRVPTERLRVDVSIPDDPTDPEDQRLSIEPFGSRVFYAIATPGVGVTPWAVAAARFPSGVSAAELRASVETTLGGTGNPAAIDRVNGPVLISEIDITTNTELAFPGFFFDGAPALFANLSAEIWREPEMLQPSDPNPFGALNVTRHQLLDRMRLPSIAENPSLARDGYQILHQGTRLLNANVPIEGTSDDRDRPYAVTFFAGYSRPIDPALFTYIGTDPPAGVPDGALPAYCIEPKDANFRAVNFTWNFSTPPNAEFLVRNRMDVTQFNNSDVSLDNGLCGARALSAWVQYMTANGNSVGNRHILHSLAINPKGPQIPYDFGGRVGFPTSNFTEIKIRSIADPRRAPINTFGADAATTIRNATAFATLSRVTLPPARSDLAGDRFTGNILPSKPTDLLTPLAFGPAFNYQLSLALTEPEFRTQSRWRWATLGETAAASLGYFRAANADLPTGTGGLILELEDPLRVYLPIVFPTSTRETYHLDRGQLKLDDYVPFLDRDGDRIFDQNPPSGEEPEFALGTGAPLAMRILDAFHGFNSSIPFDLTKSAPGVININTAPLPVLSVLPTTAPPSRLAGRNEIQQIQFTGASGNYQIVFDGQPSIVVNIGAGIAGLTAALDSIPELVGNYLPSGTLSGGTGTVQIAFTGALGERDVPLLQLAGVGAPVTELARGREGTGNSSWYEPAPAGALSSQADLASTILSYRDKLPVDLRQPSYADGLPLDPVDPGESNDGDAADAE